ncbi:MAG: hypothetical protein ACXW2E_01805 [Nitrososphaeraceae archaeon]
MDNMLKYITIILLLYSTVATAETDLAEVVKEKLGKTVVVLNKTYESSRPDTFKIYDVSKSGEYFSVILPSGNEEWLLTEDYIIIDTMKMENAE